MNLIAKLVLAAAACLPIAAHAITFTPGDYYASTGQAINHYGTNGALLESLSITTSGPETRGIAFGADGNLYVVRNNAFTGGRTGDASVDVIDKSGAVLRSYDFSGWIGGVLTTGNIQFAPDGKSFYVGALDGVYRFTPENTRGTKLIDGGGLDIEVLSNGDILMAGGYELKRYDASGGLIATVDSYINDPLGLAAEMSPVGVWLTDVNGIEYDETSNTTFVTMLGYSDMHYKILALDGFGNTLKGISFYENGAEMALAPNGDLLVASKTQAPGVFAIGSGMPLTMNLNGRFEGPPALFVTAMPVPEPETAVLTLAGLATLAAAVRRRRNV